MKRKLWGGRFSKKTDPVVEKFTRSIQYDSRLVKYDVEGSLYHIEVLKKSGYITRNEFLKLKSALKRIQKLVKTGQFEVDTRCEDIHTQIQNMVYEMAGEVAEKLHTARSRNEQVLFDMKLFCRDAVDEIIKHCLALQNSILMQSDRAKRVVIPGYTHLQHSQPVQLSLYLKSYVEMIRRDIKRLVALKSGITLTMGSGAMAGVPVNSSLFKMKKGGHRINPPSNPIYEISDRDFIMELLCCISILGMHLSRFSEDLIIWSTKEFDFVELDDAFATGSSLMPQKKNPDVLELIRGYTGVLYGNLMNVLTVMKGLPLTYNRDMQLDKIPLFSSVDVILEELRVLARLIKKLRWKKDVIRRRLHEDEPIYATDLVYYLVGKGIPFKKAHDIIGRLISFSMKSGKNIRDMSDATLSKFSKQLRHSEIIKIMEPWSSVKTRTSVR